MLRVMGGKRRFLILETPTLILTVPVGQIYRATAIEFRGIALTY